MDRAEYGTRLLAALAERLKSAGIKGAGSTSLKLARLFYSQFPRIGQAVSDLLAPGGSQEKMGQTVSDPCTPSPFPATAELPSLLSQLSTQFTLGWSHYVELLTLDDTAERRFYEIETAANQWSVRELQRQIASSLYQRLALSRDKEEIRRLATEGQVVEKAADLIKNPLVLEFLGLEDRPHYSEDELEAAIIAQLESFLLELGKGFLFEARQKRLTFDNDHFRVDLVFYNRLLRCYVLVDLKRDKLTHQDLGQMQMYVNYFDRHVKLPDELPTIGILLCHRKNDALVELTLPPEANIFASKYQLYLPSKEELKAHLEQITHDLEGGLP
jgi:predicted nuclease of restriction endonuclease-like (RecB) superfamily